MRKQLAIFLIAASLTAVAQTAPPQKPAPAPKKVPGAQNGADVPRTPEAIVKFLIPDNVAYVERLGQVPPADAIAALKKARPEAMGTQADAIAFLLVLLGSEPEANRARLLDSLNSCTRTPDDCHERVIAYVGTLAERGDVALLDPLLNAANTTDSGLTEALASSFDDIVVHDPTAFITAVSRRPVKEQRRLCTMVASGDGVGLSDDTEPDVLAALEKLSHEAGPVASTARLCLSEIKSAK